MDHREMGPRGWRAGPQMGKRRSEGKSKAFGLALRRHPPPFFLGWYRYHLAAMDTPQNCLGRAWKAIKRAVLGKSDPSYVAELVGDERCLERAFAAQLGWPNCRSDQVALRRGTV